MLEILFWGLVSWCHLPAWGEPRPKTDQFLHLMTRVQQNTKSFGFGGILQSIQITLCPYKQKLLVLPSNLASLYVLRCLMLVLVGSLFATFKEGTGTFHIFTLHYITLHYITLHYITRLILQRAPPIMLVGVWLDGVGFGTYLSCCPHFQDRSYESYTERGYKGLS